MCLLRIWEGENEHTNPNETAACPQTSRAGFLLWLARIVAGLLVLAVIGAIWESTSEAADVRAYPPPGQMVDVGGYRLHIDCTGTGSPTVVIDAGLGRLVRDLEELGAAGSGKDHAGLHL